MPVNFDSIEIGAEYGRPDLADLWGYDGWQPLSRGVFTPAGTNQIILFVTAEKQTSLTQYADYLDGNTLWWEGEKAHGTDARIIRSPNSNDEIHLFYRQVHHAPFTYYGRVELKGYQARTDLPSRFEFIVPALVGVSEPRADLEGITIPPLSPATTETRAILRSRVGQGAFRGDTVKFGGWASHRKTDPKRPVLLRPARRL